MSVLIDNTVVVHPQTGQPVLLAKGGPVPGWADGLVGSHLLADDDGQPVTADDEVARLKARIAELEAAGAASPSPPDSDTGRTTVPPRGGPGSGAPAWREYAQKVGVEVSPEASREDVIEALEAAGKPTE